MVITACGSINLFGCEATITEMTANCNYSPHYRLLLDLRKTQFEPSTDESQELALFFSENCSGQQHFEQ